MYNTFINEHTFALYITNFRKTILKLSQILQRLVGITGQTEENLYKLWSRQTIPTGG